MREFVTKPSNRSGLARAAAALDRSVVLAGVVALSVVVAGARPITAAQPPPTEWEVLDQRPGDGEQCLVCGKRIYGEDIVEIRYQGRTFYVGKPFLGDFEGDPARYFAKLQARSALFDEESLEGVRSMAVLATFDFARFAFQTMMAKKSKADRQRSEWNRGWTTSKRYCSRA